MTNIPTADKIQETQDKKPFVTHIDEEEIMCLFKRHHSKVSKYAVCILIGLILPANLVRLSEFLNNVKVSKGEIFFMLFMYWENFFVASLELQFVLICYSIYLRFFEINIMLENIYNNSNRPLLEFIVGGGMKYHIVDDLFIDNLGKEVQLFCDST